jgi:hypothetical protein
MTELNLEVTYFEIGGPHNTERALDVAKKYADQFGIKEIVIASTTGMTAQKAKKIFDLDKHRLIIVTHSYYFGGPDKRQEFPEELIEDLRKDGLIVFSATHAFGSVERSLRMSLKHWAPVEMMAKYLRENFSQGTKVCMEIATMVADAGLISNLEDDIICIGGTGRGADTVCLIKPTTTSLFHQLRVKAILAKPL